MVHQLESELWSLFSLLLHVFRVLKKAMISWKRRAEPSISSSHKHLKDVTFEVKLQPKNYIQDVVSNSDVSKIGDDEKVPRKMRKRPATIVVPEADMGSAFVEASKQRKVLEEKDVEVEGNGYWLVSRRGRGRRVREDGHGVITNINGDSKMAIFGVFDGHGGRAAVDFVSEKLGRNILEAVSQMEGVEQVKSAIRAGYLTTDREFLSQGVSSGVCAATVVLKNGELHASNVGDCRVVLSRKGVATALTRDHSAGSEDERSRIESSGGYVTCHNGVWRVHDTLAVSRAIGDANMKKWVISEPETTRLRLTPDCEFLIMASDGLWDKVSNQEAVDVISRHENSMIKSGKALVDMSISRGGRDDITVMVIDLQRFVQLEG